MTPLSNHTDTDVRRIHELNDMNTSAWSSQELHYHQRVMSDLSPWLNAQGIKPFTWPAAEWPPIRTACRISA